MIEDPADADNVLFFRSENAVTVSSVDCLVNAATSVVIAVEECDSSGGSCVGTDVASGTCGTTITALTVANSGIDAGDIIRIDVGTVTGTPEQVLVCVRFSE